MLLVLLLVAAVSAEIPYHPLNAPFNPRSQRVINGEEATPHSHPWQISLQRSGSHFCGGSVISEYYVMSAAHCLVYTSITVNLGAHDWHTPDQSIAAADQQQHPQYNSNTLDFDFGIVRLLSAANFNDKVGAIPLVAAGVEFTDGTTAITSGWGYINRFPAIIPDMLQEASIPLRAASVCASYWSGSLAFTDQMQCAAGNGGSSSCMGDSGGPLIVADTSSPVGYTLIGAVSWGSSTCSTSAPSGYAKLSSVREWIYSETGL